MSTSPSPPLSPPQPQGIPPGKPEPPVAEMVVRWAAIGCFTTLIVLAVAFVVLLVVAGRGIFG